MGAGAGTSKEKQSWNDQFENFMVGKDLPKKTKKEEQGPEEEESKVTEGAPAEESKKEDTMVDDKRLFVMNLSYQVTKEELEELFGKFGEIVDVEIPFRKYGKGLPLGLGFVRYTTSEAAISAFAALDK